MTDIDPLILEVDAFVSERIPTARERVDLYITMAFHEIVRLGLNERMALVFSSSVRSILSRAFDMVPNPRIRR